jgi:predicted dehydrogenase
MAAQQRIRVGIVGAGANTRERHIPGLQAIPGVEIVSVANRSRESGRRVADAFGIPRVYDRWEDLVAAGDTDAVVVGTWPYMHCPVTIAALEARKHVLCEARMAMDSAEARRMLAASQARPDLVAQVVPAPMSFGVDATIQRLIAEGFLGTILAIDVHADTPAFANPDAPLHWRQDRSRSGLNVMALGIWYETVMRWAGVASQVVALGKVSVPERPDPETGQRVRVEIPDHLDVVAAMECGAQAHYQLSGVTGFAPPASAWLFGAEGTLQFRADDEILYAGRRGDSGLRQIEVPPAERGTWRVEQEFVDAIRGVAPVRLTTFEDGVRYMEFTEAVARSMQGGAAVSLPLV